MINAFKCIKADRIIKNDCIQHVDECKNIQNSASITHFKMRLLARNYPIQMIEKLGFAGQIQPISKLYIAFEKQLENKLVLGL